MSTQEIEHLHALPRHLLPTYLLWKEGSIMKDLLTKDTYHRHKKSLKAFGINIAIPPIERTSTIKIVPLITILKPQAVTFDDIPEHLHKYIFEPKKHLRVA